MIIKLNLSFWWSITAFCSVRIWFYVASNKIYSQQNSYEWTGLICKWHCNKKCASLWHFVQPCSHICWLFQHYQIDYKTFISILLFTVTFSLTRTRKLKKHRNASFFYTWNITKRHKRWLRQGYWGDRQRQGCLWDFLGKVFFCRFLTPDSSWSVSKVDVS